MIMFWVEDAIGDRVPIEERNIYAVCPHCKREFQVTINDFAWFIQELSGTLTEGMYCGECTAYDEDQDMPEARKPRLHVIMGKGR